jgi:hypothetical protein
MATQQKQTSSASLDAALIKGEYNAGKSGSYRTVNLGLADQFKSKSLLAAAQSQKAANDKIHSDLKNNTGFQADLQKITGDDVGVIQNQMYANKTEIAEITKRIQNGSPEDKIIGEQQIAVLKNGAATLNGYMEDVFNLKAEYRENVKLGKMSNVTDVNKSKQLAQALGQDGGYQLILNGNNPPTYKLKDGTILTHDELDDFAIKDDAIGMEIVDEAETMMANGKQGRTFNEKDQSMYKNKLTRTLTPQQVESLIYDDLIDGQSFITAMGNVSADASFEEKREAVATALVENMAEVHKVGLGEYQTKQKLKKNGKLGAFHQGIANKKSNKVDAISNLKEGDNAISGYGSKDNFYAQAVGDGTYVIIDKDLDLISTYPNPLSLEETKEALNLN